MYLEKITIIVPIYNAQKYLQNCIESILKQLHTNLEILLVNDGSTDKSAQICYEFAQKDSRVKVIDKQNGGVTTAVFVGIRNATGIYTCFVDADDTIAPDMINVLYENIVKHKADMVQCGYIHCFESENKNFESDALRVYEKGEELTAKFFTESASLAPISNSRWNKIYKTIILKQIITDINEELNIGEDLLFNLYYLAVCGKVVVLKQACLYYYRFVESSASHSHSTKRINAILLLIEELRAFAKKHKYSTSAVESYSSFENAVLIYTTLISDFKLKQKRNVIKALLKNGVYKQDFKKAVEKETLPAKVCMQLIRCKIISLPCLLVSIYFKKPLF